jgi:hypothetical protein
LEVAITDLGSREADDETGFTVSFSAVTTSIPAQFTVALRELSRLRELVQRIQYRDFLHLLTSESGSAAGCVLLLLFLRLIKAQTTTQIRRRAILVEHQQTKITHL